MLRKLPETAVGLERISLAGEHPGRVFAIALEREYTSGKRKSAGQVIKQQPFRQLAMVFILR